MNTMQCRFQGFTVLELLVAIGILTILTSLAWGGWMEILPMVRLEAALGELVSDMQGARMKAISENRVYSIRFDMNRQEYQVFRKHNGKKDIVKTVRLPEKYPGIRYGYNGVEPIHGTGPVPAARFLDGEPEAAFYPTGMGKTGTVYLMVSENLNTSGRRRAITVACTGRIKIWRHTGVRWE